MTESQKIYIRRRAEEADKAICKVAAEGEKAFRMSIPPDSRDTDILVTHLCRELGTRLCREDVPALLADIQGLENALTVEIAL